MTLNYSAKITVDAKDKTTAIYDSVNADNEFYPENPVKTKIKLNQKLVISVEIVVISLFVLEAMEAFVEQTCIFRNLIRLYLYRFN